MISYVESYYSVNCVMNPLFCASFLRQKDSLTWEDSYLKLENFKVRFFWERKFVNVLKRTTVRCLEELNNLNLGGDAYLALFTLIGAHSVVRFDGNELKNERKCTPRNEKMTKMYAIHWKNCRKSTSWWAKGDSLAGDLYLRLIN